MISGMTTISLNQNTLCEMIQTYLNEKVFNLKNQVTVKSVTNRGGGVDACTYDFHIEKKEEED